MSFKFFRNSFLLLISVFIIGCSSVSQQMPYDSRVITGKLDNGLSYYIRHNDKPKDRIEMRLIVKAGSILEDDDQQGVAHFLEHMSFNGTEHFDKQELVNYLESIGMRFGSGLNAQTSFDQTIYQLQVPASKPEYIDKAFLILSDWAFAIRNTDTEIEKERGVVIDEWRRGLGAARRIMDKQFPVVFYGSRYAERLPIGKKEILESFKPQLLRDFYQKWYRPDMMGIVIVGSADPTNMIQHIQKSFGTARTPEKAPARPSFDIPNHSNTLVSIVSDPEATSSQVAILWKLPRTTYLTYSDYRDMLIQYLFSSMLNMRLDELRLKPSTPFLAAGAGKSKLMQPKDVFSLQAHVKDNEFLSGLDAILTETERVRQHGFTAGELERMKANFLTAIQKRYAERETTESDAYVGLYIDDFTDGSVTPSVETELPLQEKYLPSITLEEVNSRIQQWLIDSNRVILVSGPEKEGIKIPTEAEVLSVFKSATSRKVDAYIDKVGTQPLLPSLPKAGTITQRSEIPELDVKIWNLSNGTKVMWKKTSFKKDEILFSAFRPGGHSQEPDEDFTAASWASSILGECGLGTFNLPDLQKKLSGKEAWVTASLSELSETLSGSCRVADLKTLFELIHLRFTSPRIDTDAFTVFKERTRTALLNRLLKPETAFVDEIFTTMTQNHLRYLPNKPEIVDRFDLDRSFRIYSRHFSSADNFVFIFVGDLDPKQLEDNVVQYIASLPSSGKSGTWKDVGMRPPNGHIEKEVRKGAEDKSQVQMIYTTGFKWNYPDRVRDSAMINILNIKLREKVREEMSGTYSIMAYPIFTHYPIENRKVTVAFGCSPAQVDTIIAAVMKEIDAMKQDPADAVYLDKVKQMFLREREVSMERNDFWLSRLFSSEWEKEDPKVTLEYPKIVQALTVTDIQKSAQECFSTNNLAIFRMFPEKEAAPKTEKK